MVKKLFGFLDHQQLFFVECHIHTKIEVGSSFQGVLWLITTLTIWSKYLYFTCITWSSPRWKKYNCRTSAKFFWIFRTLVWLVLNGNCLFSACLGILQLSLVYFKVVVSLNYLLSILPERKLFSTNVEKS